MAGIEKIEIGDTIADVNNPVAMPRLTVDEPTLQMVFSVNSSPFAGRSGKFVTTRNLRDRLCEGTRKERRTTSRTTAGHGCVLGFRTRFVALERVDRNDASRRI